MRVFLIGALVLTSLTGPAFAEDVRQDGWLTLKAKTSRGTIVLDGAVWTCKVDVCRAPKVRNLTAQDACKDLKSRLGEVTGFGYRGTKFDSEALATCNAG